MKSNHERSNGCLPPKKREILALEHRPVVVAAAAAAPMACAAPNDSPHTENLAWLASVASERCRSTETVSPRCPVAVTSSSSTAASSPLSAVPLTSLHTIYPTALAPQAGTIQYAQLAPSVQFISSGPYAGYISSQILPTSTSSHSGGGGGGGGGASQRHHLEGYTAALVSPGSKAGEQQQPQQFHIGLSPDLAVTLPSSTQVTGQYIQLDSSPLTVSAPNAHLPLQLHAHPAGFPHTLTLAPSQLVVQYAEPPAGKKVEGHIKGQLNGELELVKQAGRPQCQQQQQQQQQVQSYETRHILLPADYGQHPQGLHTSLLLVAQPNSTAEAEHSPGKLSLLQTEKGGICLGKPVSRASSFTSLSSLPSSETLKSSSHPVLQTSHSSEEMPASLYASSQPPIIGYIASGGQQHAVSYHATLPQHLVMSGGQSLLIPVSGASRAPDLEASPSITALTTATTSPRISTAMPHTYLATALSKSEVLGPDGHHQAPAIAQAPVLPLLSTHPAPAVMAPPSPAPALAPVSVQASPSPSSSAAASTPALPPFFMRGSIIQLADGELKRVEDLRTEDFIQSAEISSELKIDSSTVERIDCGQSPNAVLIQFAVGELKAQVCVEVLLEYPFFVFGQGWSSCCPDRTTQLFELSCAKLCVGDVCVSLTLRGLRNGAVRPGGPAVDPRARSSQHPEGTPCLEATAARNSTSTHAAGSTSGLLMKATRAQGPERDPAAGPGLTPGPGDVAYGGAGHRGSSNAQAGPASGDLKQGDQRTQAGEGDKPAGRKRRWSAPERDQTEKADEEPPATLPKPSFIPQEVKISIEGRSNIGS
ncbi:ataxin-1-like [Aplochiton taeniatus]